MPEYRCTNAAASAALFQTGIPFAPFHLYYYEGYHAEEIAAMVGAKPAAIRQRLARAREKLRKELEGSGYETV